MTTRTLNDLFEPESTDAQLHPRLRRWQKLVADGFCFTLEIYRKWDGLTYAPTRMFVHIRKGDGDPGTLDEILWEEELNQGLIRLGVAAVDINQESMRYALSFRYAFGAVSSRHGQDFFLPLLVIY